MKEAVLKIIRERIDSLKEYSTSLSLRTSKGVIEFQIKEAEAIFRLISALPEQGYTREQVMQAIEIEMKEANEACGIEKKTASDFQVIGMVTCALERLPSLTPVAVEAERTERWIPVTERMPEVKKRCVVCWASQYGRHREDAVLLSDGKWYDDLREIFNVTHWFYIPELPILQETNTNN